MVKIRRVVGESMVPTLHPGDIVPVKNPGHVKTGDIVVAHIDGREVIKRVAKIRGGSYYLKGDNPASSTDSRSYGDVPSSAIVGVVMMKLRLAKSKPAPKVKDKKLLAVPYALATFLGIVLLVLLLRIDTFIAELNLLITDEPASRLAAAFASVLLLLSLPFLLRLDLSPLMRVVSAVASLLAPLTAMLVAPFLFVKENSEYAFAANAESAGVWSVVISMTLFAIALWSFYILGGQHVFNRLRNKK